jgi:hypothetical protein
MVPVPLMGRFFPDAHDIPSGEMSGFQPTEAQTGAQEVVGPNAVTQPSLGAPAHIVT